MIIVPYGENLRANVSHKIDFIVPMQPDDYVDKISIEFGNVPIGFKALDSKPIIIEFILSNNINDFDDLPEDPLHKKANNIANLKYIIDDKEIAFSDNDDIQVRVPYEHNFRKESNETKGKFVKTGNDTTFSLYDVANKSNEYHLENFSLEDTPDKGLNFKNIIIPAYENADDVIYTVKYKLSSGDDIFIVLGGENLRANIGHTVNFTVQIDSDNYVDRIYVDFGNVPVGFKPVNERPIVIRFTLSKDINDFNFLPGSTNKIANNIAYLKFRINGEDNILEDNDYILVKERCKKTCEKKLCVKKICTKCKNKGNLTI